jgi:hypothetical protein
VVVIMNDPEPCAHRTERPGVYHWCFYFRQALTWRWPPLAAPNAPLQEYKVSKRVAFNLHIVFCTPPENLCCASAASMHLCDVQLIVCPLTACAGLPPVQAFVLARKGSLFSTRDAVQAGNNFSQGHLPLNGVRTLSAASSPYRIRGGASDMMGDRSHGLRLACHSGAVGVIYSLFSGSPNLHFLAGRTVVHAFVAVQQPLPTVIALKHFVKAARARGPASAVWPAPPPRTRGKVGSCGYI